MYYHGMLNMKGSCPVLLSSGHVGLAVGACQVGDDVIIPLGSRTPLVIRPSPNQGSHVMIGEAYVHDTMQGEYLAQSSVGPSEYILV